VTLRSDGSLNKSSSSLVLLSSDLDTLESLELESLKGLSVVLGRDETVRPEGEGLEFLLQSMGSLCKSQEQKSKNEGKRSEIEENEFEPSSVEDQRRQAGRRDKLTRGQHIEDVEQELWELNVLDGLESVGEEGGSFVEEGGEEVGGGGERVEDEGGLGEFGGEV